MALRRKTQLNAASNIAANSTATFDLPVDRRYHAVFLEYATTAGVLKTQAQIATEILRVELKLNGKVVRSHKPAQLAAICTLNGFAMQDGYIPLFFSEPWMRDTSNEDAGAWSLAGSNISSFQIDVIFGAAVTPALSGFMEDDEIRTPFLIKQNTVIRPSISGTGITTLTDFPVRGIYQALYCFETAANDIKSLRLKVQNNELFYMTRNRMNVSLRSHGSVPQAGLFAARFNDVNRWDHGIPSHANVGNALLSGPSLAKSLEFDMAVANTFDLVAEFVSPYI